MSEQPATPEQPYVSPGHKVPADQWAQVRENAKKYRAESEESETE